MSICAIAQEVKNGDCNHLYIVHEHGLFDNLLFTSSNVRFLWLYDMVPNIAVNCITQITGNESYHRDKHSLKATAAPSCGSFIISVYFFSQYNDIIPNYVAPQKSVIKSCDISSDVLHINQG